MIADPFGLDDLLVHAFKREVKPEAIEGAHCRKKALYMMMDDREVEGINLKKDDLLLCLDKDSEGVYSFMSLDRGEGGDVLTVRQDGVFQTKQAVGEFAMFLSDKDMKRIINEGTLDLNQRSLGVDVREP